MSELKRHVEIERGSERGFGLVFAAVFAIVALWPLVDGGGLRLWALGLAAVFLGLAFLYPSALAPLNLAWFKFGMLLGHVVAPLVMALLFFLVVTPTALVMRLLGKDLLRLKAKPAAASYWIRRSRDERPMGSMRNQF